MDVTQSAIKRFYDDTYCKIRWWAVFIEGENIHDPTDAMKHGLYFEQELIGGTRDGDIIELRKGSNGQKLKPERDIDALIERAKIQFDEWGLVISEVQPEYRAGDLVAHIDAMCSQFTLAEQTIPEAKESILDVKLTETKEGDVYVGWGDANAKDHIQAVHYVYTENKKRVLEMGPSQKDIYKPFFYLVFSTKAPDKNYDKLHNRPTDGWMRIIRAQLTLEALTKHEMLINRFRRDVQKFKPKPINDFNTCLACPIRDKCEFATKVPQIETISVY